METLILWICSQTSDPTDLTFTADVVRQISSKIIMCGDRVYHRKFRYKLQDVIIEFKINQKRLNELIETQ